MSESRKIPYRFIPLPKFFVENEYINDVYFLQFICFAFSRTLFEPGHVIFYQNPIFLEAFEFIFGRLKWSQLLQQEEHIVRKYISQLQSQHLVRKIASKSTSKYTVFVWEKEHFCDFSNQQNDRKLTDKLPAGTPQYKNKNIEKEAAAGNIEKAPIAAVAFFEMEGVNSVVKKMFSSLLPAEQQKVLALLKVRTKKQPIDNLSGWVRRCIEERWYEQQEMFVEQMRSSPIEANKKLAILLSQKLSSAIQIVLRSDFIEVEGRQLFYHEDTISFRRYLEIAIQKAGFDLSEVSSIMRWNSLETPNF